MAFQDEASEAAVNAGILRFGRDAFIDCEGVAEPDDFTVPYNHLIFSCAIEHYASGTDRKFDYASLLSAGKRLGVSHALDDPNFKKYFRDLGQYPVDLASVRPEAAKLLKLRVARRLDELAAGVRKGLHGVTGDEPLGDIQNLVEAPFFEYMASLSGGENDTKQIGQGIDGWLEHVLALPRDNIGIPTPWPTFNRWLGGGFRRRGVSVIGARPKQGKSSLLANLGLHVAGTLGIPVMNLDTEMSDEEHWARMLAHLTGIEADRIERGKVSPAEADLLREKSRWLKSIPYYYRSVIDESFEEQVAAMRRWVVKDVGTDEEGVRGDCLVLYDYLQLTDPAEFKGKDFKEYQLLGFQMVALSRMAKRYDVPILSALQLNRDGIDKVNTGVAAGSDRIIWKCFNFSILRRKEDSEVEADGPEHGNTQLYNLISRHGPAGGTENYLHLKFDLATSKITEGPTRFELDKGKKRSTEKGFAVEDDPSELPPWAE